MKPDQRQEKILEILDQEESATVEYLAERFAVSHETIRRDLSTLYTRRMIRKVHGGAEKAQTAREAPFEVRARFNQEQKAAIALCAVSFIADGDSLLINSGTTTTAFANELKRLSRLMVITNCASVAHEVWRVEEHTNKAYLLGGEYDGDYTETNGSFTIDQIREFQTDHAILTVGAINDAIGVMEYRVEAAQVSRAMIEQARSVTLLVDSSKLDQVAVAKVCRLSDIDRLITDASPSQELQEAFNDAGIDVVVASQV